MPANQPEHGQGNRECTQKDREPGIVGERFAPQHFRAMPRACYGQRHLFACAEREQATHTLTHYYDASCDGARGTAGPVCFAGARPNVVPGLVDAKLLPKS